MVLLVSEAQETRLWKVAGVVQGVGFRWFVSRNARALGVDGWVQNMTSGEVLVHARGAPEVLRQLHQIILEGPPHARVERIDDLDGEAPSPPAAPFSILG
jgi:acylphosphatase